MKKSKEIGLDFILDKLTKSIENVVTGDSFATDISLLSNNDLKLVSKILAGGLIGVTNLNDQNAIFIN